MASWTTDRIPEFTAAGVLPLIEFARGPKSSPTAGSPYRCSLEKFKLHFGWNSRRIEMINGLCRFRADLARIGLASPYQWIGGSFVEQVDSPNDIDILVYYRAPPGIRNVEQMDSFAKDKKSLFYKDLCKKEYSCEPNFILLTNQPEHLVRNTSYWMGLFTYSPRTGGARGIVEIPAFFPGSFKDEQPSDFNILTSSDVE